MIRVEYNQDAYIESVKGVINEFLKENVKNIDIAVAFPDITGDGFSLSKPLVYVEFERELNIDTRAGRKNGQGKRSKRKMLTYSMQIVTTGDNAAVLQRDRIIQTITNKVMQQNALLSGKGIRKAETKFVGSYRVRELVHLARIEFYCEIKFLN